MIATSLFSTPRPVARKINRLCALLLKERNLFEEVAGYTADTALRKSILSLAQQNNQYAAELYAHLQTTNSLPADAGAGKEKLQARSNIHLFADEKGMLSFCNSNEKKVVSAYQKILQEVALYEGLRNMMRYQLNGIQFACTQLKLLTSLKRTGPAAAPMVS